MISLEHKIPPPLVGALVATGMWGIAALGPQLPLSPALRYLAVPMLVAAGIACDMSGILAFRRSRTTVNPLKPQNASSMVTGGVYRITRNPMYLGMVFLLTAWAVYLSALLPFLGPVVFVLYITHFQIKPEEGALERIFGDEYRSYASRVRRWL